ncbi:hypothetical protein KAH37_05485, partial [bacterium]|nr:hypothetical protein [bacterium]
SCGSGKSTPPTDEDSGTTNDDITTDSDAVSDADNELSDAESDIDGDETVDIDVAPTITINCPESVDETEDSASCTITSNSESIALVEDSCSGTLHRTDMLYDFNLYEALGPSVCTLTIKNNDTGELATASIIINEVNETPRIQAEIEMFFYEGVVKKNSIIVPDSDLPNDTPGDPGFLTCSLKDNTCGDWVSVAKIDYRTCEISGMMPEALTDGNCSFTFVVEDGYGAKTEQVVTTELREKNDAPVWTTDTVPISLLAGTAYSKINGTATDSDLPNAIDGDPGFVTCVLDSDSCSFDVSVTTERVAGKASCRVSFTAGDVTENCRMYYHITDGNTNVALPIPVTIAVTASVSINCPKSVNEGEEIECDVAAIGGDPGAQAWSVNTCHGTVVKEGDDWKYRYTTTEADGPKICDAAVAIGTLLASDSVEIKEVNQIPTLWFTNSSGATVDPAIFEATEGINIFINAKFTDSDMPRIATTDPGYVSCEVKSNSCGSWLLFNAANCMGSGAPDETAGGTECSYTIEVADGYGATVSETVTITINEYNHWPVCEHISAFPNRLMMTGEVVTLTMDATDVDTPNSSPGDSGYLRCELDIVNTTCNQNPYNDTIIVSGEGAGAVTCSIEITAAAISHGICKIGVKVVDGYGRERSDFVNLHGVRTCVLRADIQSTANDPTGRWWNEAFPTIQEAVDASRRGCEVWVTQGTYTQEAGDRSSVLTMKNGVKVIGGFCGTTNEGVSPCSTRASEDPDKLLQNAIHYSSTGFVPAFRNDYNVIYDINHSVLNGESTAYHVVKADDSDINLDGFIIKNGNADGSNDDEKSGGGIYSSSVRNVFIENCIFENNSATANGAAIMLMSDYAIGGPSSTIKNTHFENNTAGGKGGAIYFEKMSSNYIDIAFFKSNRSLDKGGAIYQKDGALRLFTSIFSENEAETVFGGGAIYLSNTEMTADHLTFDRNFDGTDYAIASSGSGIKSIKNSIFWRQIGQERRNEAVLSPDNFDVSYTIGSGATSGEANKDLNTINMFRKDGEDFYLDAKSQAIRGGSVVGMGPDMSDMGAVDYDEIKAEYFVDCSATVSGNGTSWDEAYSTLFQATFQIASGGSGGVVFVKTGVCTESGGAGHIANLTAGAKIYGGFDGTETYLKDRSLSIDNLTILDGEKKNITAIKTEGSTNNVIDGFIVQNAYNGGLADRLHESEINNCIFRWNRALKGGALNLNLCVNSVIKNTIFMENYTSGSYGTIDVSLSSYGPEDIVFYNTIFLQNAVHTDNQRGSAINPNNNRFLIKNSIFYRNIQSFGTFTQVRNADSTNTSYSLTNEVTGSNNLSGDPEFEHLPEYFGVTASNGKTNELWFSNLPLGPTADHLIEINADGLLRTVTSISGQVVYFSPALPVAASTGTLVRFWPAGTTDTEIDLYLKSSSQCIDAGTYIEETIYDIESRRRFNAGDTEILFDIGFYEY